MSLEVVIVDMPVDTDSMRACRDGAWFIRNWQLIPVSKIVNLNGRFVLARLLNREGRPRGEKRGLVWIRALDFYS